MKTLYKKIISLMALLIFCFAPAAWAQGTIDLPKTGQSTCYDEENGVIDCAGTGQDGDIQAGVEWPSPRFTDNNDGTVTDNLTGLMWLKDGNCFGLQPWQGALDVVTGVNTSPLTYNCSDYTANYDDWRLPNVLELESLVNAEESNPATWLNTQGFTNVQSSYYWSATTDAYYSYSAWYVSMLSGGVYNVYYMSYNYYVWPVRAGQSGPAQTWQTGQTTSYAAGDDGDLQRGVSWPAPRFEDNGDGTITDHLTGLIWLKNANCLVAKIWSQALADCNNLANGSCGLSDGSISGDWRLPNRKELLSLIDYSQHSPALPQGHLFDNVQSSYYWSATTCAYDSSNAWAVNMNYDGSVYLRIKSYSYDVWPVRAGQGGIFPDPVIANFNADALTGRAPLAVSFTDQSMGSITSWEWDFGDGSISTEQNPSHTYTDHGTYTVSLTVTGPGGSNTETKTDYIVVEDATLIANFIADTTSGVAPLTVNFTDESVGDITDWLWDFGDGETSTNQNPIHIYDDPGTSTVSLTVTGPQESDTEIKEAFITVTKSIDIADIGNTKLWLEEEKDYPFLQGGWAWFKSDGTLIDDEGETGIYRVIAELTIEIIYDYASYDDSTLTFPKSNIEVGDRVEVIFKNLPSSVFYFIVTDFIKMTTSNGDGDDGGGGGGGGG